MALESVDAFQVTDAGDTSCGVSEADRRRHQLDQGARDSTGRTGVLQLQVRLVNRLFPWAIREVIGRKVPGKNQRFNSVTRNIECEFHERYRPWRDLQIGDRRKRCHRKYCRNIVSPIQGLGNVSHGECGCHRTDGPRVDSMALLHRLGCTGNAGKPHCKGDRLCDVRRNNSWEKPAVVQFYNNRSTRCANVICKNQRRLTRCCGYGGIVPGVLRPTGGVHQGY